MKVTISSYQMTMIQALIKYGEERERASVYQPWTRIIFENRQAFPRSEQKRLIDLLQPDRELQSNELRELTRLIRLSEQSHLIDELEAAALLRRMREEAERNADPNSLKGVRQSINSFYTQLERKKIPGFYFTEAAVKLGIPTQTCRPSKIESILRGTNQDTKQYRDMLSILLETYNRLRNTPEDQTYHQATRCLKKRINDLKKDYSHNQIAIQANLSHKTLTDLIQDDERESYRRHRCPWDLLEKLEDAEEKIEIQKDYTSHQQKIMRPGKNGGTTSAPKKPTEYDLIEPGDPCLKCGASWNHLNKNGEDIWQNVIMTCIICSKDNLINLEIIRRRHQQEKRTFEYEGKCPGCLAPWQNQIREGTNQDQNPVYTCNICYRENIIEHGKTVIPGGR